MKWLKHSTVVLLLLLPTVLFGNRNNHRTVLLVSQKKEAGWEDFAYLAAVPASRKANEGNGAVIALESSGAITREIGDYLERYKPHTVYHVGSSPLIKKPSSVKLHELSVSSADRAAIAMSETFWKSSVRVVLCPERDYASALMASALAGRLGVPLFFFGEQGLSSEAIAAIRRLDTKELLCVGTPPKGTTVTELLGIEEIISWLKIHDIDTSYFAVVNVRDRSATTIRRLSLIAPVLASARDGMVIPLDLDIQWKMPKMGEIKKEPDAPVILDQSKSACDKLRRIYASTGIPQYLCLIGFPDAIPQAVLTRRNKYLTSDLPYGNVDEDIFSEISVGRMIAENVSFATLHASRIITYDDLLEAEWSKRAGQARWENTMTSIFENVGLDASAYHNTQDLKWIRPPSKEGEKGRRAGSFEQDDTLAHVALLSHMAHSDWKNLGQTYDMDSSTLVSPMVVESGGCLTGALDCEPKFRSVISRLFRNGAVSFVGQTREGIAQQLPQRHQFWNTVLTGGSIGDAHRKSQNTMAVTILEKDQETSGPDYYQLYIRSLFGDPAFTPHVPETPISKPARVTATDKWVTVFAPQTWWKKQIAVPEDWKKWADKPLYVIRGAGTYACSSWCSEEYDREEVYAMAEFSTRKEVKSIKQVQSLPEPLGWNGKYTIDENPDGSRTYRWRVRLVNFDQIKGVIISKVDRVSFQISY